ncbi:hypothetical protein [Sphingomonas sp. 3-13AW]|uniref:hypothetical protein n=1 Tax=Sphingomonas sp. 3-13AW TaxID=3050450 RepID=UPI003BB7CE47
MEQAQIKIMKRDRKVMLRLAGLPGGTSESLCMTSEEAQCAANAITRLPKENREGRVRYGALEIVHFPHHHQPVELRFSGQDLSVIVDLSRIESYTIGDMLRGAGVSDRPFDAEADLQYVPRVQNIHKDPLPDSLTSLLNLGSARLSDFVDDEAEEPAASSRRLPSPKDASERHNRPSA